MIASYRVVIVHGGVGFGVVFPDFPGCVSVGADADEAARNAREALLLHIEGMIEEGLELPEPSALDDPLPGWMRPSDFAGAYRFFVPVEMPAKGEGRR